MTFNCRSILILLSLCCAVHGNGPDPSPSTDAKANGIPYRVGQTWGIVVEDETISGTVLVGEGPFTITLLPENGGAWDMSEVSVLGIQSRNTGQSGLTLDLMAQNDGATNWSNSAVGRTIASSGEDWPLGIPFWRRSSYAGNDPAYIRMSGLPDGSFRHWHKFDPARVKRIVISCTGQGSHRLELGKMEPLRRMYPERIGEFPFIDRYGQYMLNEWDDKVHSDKDIRDGIDQEQAFSAELPEAGELSRFLGWKNGPRLEATGRFRVQEYEGRWWFVDPEGYLFWSFGANCVGVDFAGQTPLGRNPAVFAELPDREDPEWAPFYTLIDVEDNYRLVEAVPHYDFTRANLYRKYGRDFPARQVESDLDRLKYAGMNTIGAWSDVAVCNEKQVPYTVMLHYEYAFAAEKLPDPFDPVTREGVRKALSGYPVDFASDPWCLGAFVNNELHFKNTAKEMVRVIFAHKEPGTAVREAFRDRLASKYACIDDLNAAWKTGFKDWEELLEIVPEDQLKHADEGDCSGLATHFADTFFRMIREELEAFSPGILYLGCRFNAASSEVVEAAARHMDVISTNLYQFSPDPGQYGAHGKPVIITEFHYANLTGNNLGSGLRSAQDSVQQGRLLKSFIAEAVEHPEIVGAHWFQWRDQSVGGRYDGENYDVGFFDVADLPKKELIRAAAESGQNLYTILQQQEPHEAK
jgi:hypothetical protein